MARGPTKLAQRLAARVKRAEPLPPVAIGEGDADGNLPLGPLLDAFAEPLLLLRDATILRANQAARSLLGVYIEGQDVRLVIRHPEAAGLLLRGDEGLAGMGGLGDSDRRWDLRVRRLDGRHRLLKLEDRSSELAAERMRTDFVANASHELRTPLAAITGFVETLEEANGPAHAKERLRFLGIMGAEARRMQRLIDDLMSLSRIEADRFVRPSATLDLADAIRTACTEIEAGGSAAGRLRLELAAAATIHADPAQISQLVHNVVGNALKYGAAGSPVEVVLALANDEALLAVTDHGEGIAAQHLPRLTERFYRVDAGRSRAVGGTGLGLAIVKYVVERHRGRLRIESTAGVGTTVHVSFPLA